MTRTLYSMLALAAALAAFSASAEPEYYPDRHDWQPIPAEAAGFDAERRQDAIDFARAAAVTEPRDLHRIITEAYVAREPGLVD